MKLPFQFAPQCLQADLAKIQDTEWMRHYNSENYEGEWSGVALRSVGGMPDLYPMMAGPELFMPTEALMRCAYFQQVLAQLEFPQTSVRLLRLGAGSRILEHSDDRLGYEEGQVRFHVPVVTHPDVEFLLEGQSVAMREGECWYLDLSRPHRCENRSAVDRVHLVIDGIANDWVTELLGF